MTETETETGTETIDEGAVGVLYAGLLHGVRTPLHSMLGFGELLVMSTLDEDQRQLAEEMITGAEEVLSACHRLSSLLTVLSTRSPNPDRTFVLPELLGEATALAGGTSPVSTRIDPLMPTALTGDRDALLDVLTELVGNAVTHGRPPVVILVEAQAGARTDTGSLRVRFSVTDTGLGLPAHVWSNLHADRPVAPPAGRRFGLYLARLLADRIGGQLTASDGLADGTTVSLAVTLRVAERPPLPPVVATRAPNLRALLIEDNTVNRMLAQRQFARLGHTLDTVTTGIAGIAAAMEGDYDIILMDRHLPDIDGIDAARQIRAAEQARPVPHRVPIVAVTADVSPGVREKCLAAGMDGFLAKPVDLERLRSALAGLAPDAPAGGVYDDAHTSRPVSASTEVDVAAIGRLTAELDGDRDAAVGLVRAYLGELPGRRLRLQGAIRRANARQTIAAADSLRSASITIGAPGVARACGRIGACAETGDLRACHEALPELSAACEQATVMLDRLASAPA